VASDNQLSDCCRVWFGGIESGSQFLIASAQVLSNRKRRGLVLLHQVMNVGHLLVG
jgi:hypothetical protein